MTSHTSVVDGISVTSLPPTFGVGLRGHDILTLDELRFHGGQVEEIQKYCRAGVFEDDVGCCVCCCVCP